MEDRRRLKRARRLTKEKLMAHEQWVMSNGLCGGRIILRNVSLRDLDLSDANLTGAIFAHVDLTNANLRGSNLRDVNFWSSQLDYADFRDSNLDGALLPGFFITLVGCRVNIAAIASSMYSLTWWLEKGAVLLS